MKSSTGHCSGDGVILLVLVRTRTMTTRGLTQSIERHQHSCPEYSAPQIITSLLSIKIHTLLFLFACLCSIYTMMHSLIL